MQITKLFFLVLTSATWLLQRSLPIPSSLLQKHQLWQLQLVSYPHLLSVFMLALSPLPQTTWWTLAHHISMPGTLIVSLTEFHAPLLQTLLSVYFPTKLRQLELSLECGLLATRWVATFSSSKSSTPQATGVLHAFTTSLPFCKTHGTLASTHRLPESSVCGAPHHSWLSLLVQTMFFNTQS